MFGQAARIFRRLLGAWWCGIQVGRGKTGTATTSGALRARQLFEQRNTGSFDKGKLDQLRDALEEFRGRDYGALFRQWQVQGDCGVAGG